MEVALRLKETPLLVGRIDDLAQLAFRLVDDDRSRHEVVGGGVEGLRLDEMQQELGNVGAHGCVAITWTAPELNRMHSCVLPLPLSLRYSRPPLAAGAAASAAISVISMWRAPSSSWSAAVVALWRYVFRDVDWDALDGLVDGRP